MHDASAEYTQHRDRARRAIGRMNAAEERQRKARDERDAEILAMLEAPGASLGSVAADLGISKSLVAIIQREARAVRRYIDENETTT